MITEIARAKLKLAGRPRALGMYPKINAITATVRLYGSCVRTCRINSQELAVELIIVVSEIGEQ
jgi:hypothetical protein